MRSRARQRERAYPFDRFVLDNQSMVYNLAYRILGNQKLAIMAAQDAFLRASPVFPNRHRKASRLWLVGLVVAVCQERMSSLSQLESESCDCSSGYSILHSDAALTDCQPPCDRAQALLDTIPPDQRVILVLSDIQGLSCKEIARVTGASLRLIRSRLSWGRNMLRNALLAQGSISPPLQA